MPYFQITAISNNGQKALFSTRAESQESAEIIAVEFGLVIERLEQVNSSMSCTIRNPETTLQKTSKGVYSDSFNKENDLQCDEIYRLL